MLTKQTVDNYCKPLSDPLKTNVAAFIKTIQHISLYAPKTILVPDTAFSGPGLQSGETASSKMVEEIDRQLGVTCRPVARRHWDSENGELCSSLKFLIVDRW